MKGPFQRCLTYLWWLGIVTGWPLSAAVNSLANDLEQQGIETAVRPGTLAFRYRSQKPAAYLWHSVEYLSGNISRTASWQKTEKIYEFLATQAGVSSESLSVPQELAGDRRFLRLQYYRIFHNQKQRELNCVHSLRSRQEGDGSRLILDFCLLPAPGKTEKAFSYLKQFLLRFAAEENWPSNFAEPVPVFAVTGQQAELKLPPLFFRVEARENRSWFIDTAGLAEAEIFREEVPALQGEELALKLYDDSISKILLQQGNWSSLGEVQRRDKNRCLLFGNPEKRLTSYCYALLPASRENQLYRVTFLVIFPEDLYDSIALQEWQLGVLESWQSRQAVTFPVKN